MLVVFTQPEGDVTVSVTVNGTVEFPETPTKVWLGFVCVEELLPPEFRSPNVHKYVPAEDVFVKLTGTSLQLKVGEYVKDAGGIGADVTSTGPIVTFEGRTTTWYHIGLFVE